MAMAVDPVDRFLEAFNDPKAMASIGAELLLPIKEIIDYKGFANKILKTYKLNEWVRGRITGHEVWRGCA